MNRKAENDLVRQVASKLRSFTTRQVLRTQVSRVTYNYDWDMGGLTDKEWLRVVGRACRLVEAEL